jgi:hypothetical protein
VTGLEGGVALVVEYESAHVGDVGAAAGQEHAEDQVFATVLDWVLERLHDQPQGTPADLAPAEAAAETRPIGLSGSAIIGSPARHLPTCRLADGDDVVTSRYRANPTVGVTPTNRQRPRTGVDLTGGER